MPEDKKRCFVVMGFGVKTDYVNGRKLDLNKSYRLLIKPVVESKGLECIRADEIRHSGSIDMQMYQELLEADIVVADLSTANPNALYELGVRHALRPYTTIVISEDKLVYPFDLNHISISSYQHLGDAIDFEEVERFRSHLGKLLDTVLAKQEPDSPVYTYLQLLPPQPGMGGVKPAITAPTTPAADAMNKNMVLALVSEQAEAAIDAKDFAKARDLFESALHLSTTKQGEVESYDAYIVHRLAFCTYKAAEPDFITALNKSLGLLGKLNLAHTNDPETVSTAGAVEKKLYECKEGEPHLENAIQYFERGYFLLNNRYNGINLALCYNYRAHAALSPSREEKVADMIFAGRVRKRVLQLCERDQLAMQERMQKDSLLQADTEEARELQQWMRTESFWIAANKAEASFGLGDFDLYRTALRQAAELPHATWMWESFATQMGRLEALLTETASLLQPVWTKPAGLPMP